MHAASETQNVNVTITFDAAAASLGRLYTYRRRPQTQKSLGGCAIGVESGASLRCGFDFYLGSETRNDTAVFKVCLKKMKRRFMALGLRARKLTGAPAPGVTVKAIIAARLDEFMVGPTGWCDQLDTRDLNKYGSIAGALRHYAAQGDKLWLFLPGQNQYLQINISDLAT